VKVPSFVTGMAAREMKPSRERDVHGVTRPPMPIPVVRPATAIRAPSREPVITTVDRGAATGVTVLDGSEEADQPAPVRALTVNVYVAPVARPSTEHDNAGAATRQV